MICQEQYCKNEANTPTPVLRTGIILCAKHDFLQIFAPVYYALQKMVFI